VAATMQSVDEWYEESWAEHLRDEDFWGDSGRSREVADDACRGEVGAAAAGRGAAQAGASPRCARRPPADVMRSGTPGRTNPPRRPSRAVLRRRRVAVGGLALIVIIACWIAGGAALGAGGSGPLTAAGASSGPQPVAYRSWIVRPGDTLWSIAEASGAKGDIRPFVDRLSAEVGGQPLQVGQRIQLP
jgi:hypothetical protein